MKDYVLTYCVDCSRMFKAESELDRFCPVCEARRLAPPMPHQHTTVPGLMTFTVLERK